ncbi:MAG: cysteine peptidase family C39 domain-containing protein, partial [bacterium]
MNLAPITQIKVAVYTLKLKPCILFLSLSVILVFLPTTASLSRLPSKDEKVLSEIVQGIKNSEQLFKKSLQDIRLDYKEEIWLDRVYQRKEFEYLEKKFGRKMVLPKEQNHQLYTREYIWYMKGDKLRCDFKDPNDGKFKPLEVFDGKVCYRYFYVEKSPSNKAYLSTGRKPGDLLQVQIEKEKTGYTSTPLLYLGYWTNGGGKWLSDELKEFNLRFLGIEKIGERSCYVVEMERESEFVDEKGKKIRWTERKKYWIDPSIGYRPIRRTDYSPQNEIGSELVWEDFLRIPSQLYLPTKIELKVYSSTAFYGKNVPIRKHSITIKNMEFNKGIQDSLFVPSFPEGTPIFDLRTGRSYKAGQRNPTDEDVLKIARVAYDFLQGKCSIKQLDGYTKTGQREGYYCGPNALLAVCGILGIKTSSKEIAQLAGTDEKGFTSLAGLKRAAEALGLKAEGVDITLDELRKSKKLAIAFIPPDHFIVVVGFSADKVVIIDP